MGEARPGFLRPISTRSPSVTIEYDCNGKRATKLFEQAHKARSFYGKKFAAGKNPRVVPNKEKKP